MMHHSFAAIGAAVLLCTTPALSHAQTTSSANTRATMPNDVAVEAGGKALIYSFSYQRMLTTGVGLEAGLGALGGGSANSNTTLIFIPVGAKLYLIPRNTSVYLTAGAVFATAKTTDKGPFGGNGSDAYGQVGIGFESRSSGGFLVRGTVYTLFYSGSYFIWPGLSVGFAF